MRACTRRAYAYFLCARVFVSARACVCVWECVWACFVRVCVCVRVCERRVCVCLVGACVCVRVRARVCLMYECVLSPRHLL